MRTTRDTFLATTSGTNVGIGKTSASYPLDVSGNMRTTSTTYLATSGGNVGIGDITPSYTLDVSGNMRTTRDTYLATTSGTNVGIGKTTASYTLDVSGNMRISNGNGSDGLTILQDPDKSALEIRKYTSDPSGGVGGMLIASNNNYNNTTENNDFLIFASGPSVNTGTMNLTVWADGTRRNGLRLTSTTATLTETGSIYLDCPLVGIGDSTPSYTLDVSGNIRTTHDTFLATTNGTKVGIGKTSASYTLDVSGNVNATSYNTTSDYRIKVNVKQLDDKFIIDKLNPITYLNNNLGKQDIGLIAHELQEIFPELVNGEERWRTITKCKLYRSNTNINKRN